jgi:hypothetical protein
MDNENEGTWRIFSKLGNGCENGNCEIHTTGYACIPIAAAGAAGTDDNTPNNNGGGGGYEFTIAARASIPAEGYDESGAEAALIETVTSILVAMVQGNI